MPELPEVETVVRGLRSELVGQKITGVLVRHEKAVGGAGKAESFALSLKDSTIQKIDRRGKIIVISLSNKKTLLIHLKLTGQLIVEHPSRGKKYGGHAQAAYKGDLPGKHTHIVVDFKNGAKLYFNDLRKFGWMKVATREELASMRELKAVGPDILSSDFNEDEFIKIAQRKKIAIYKLLFDQKIIAGLGNIYVNEALHCAGMHPLAPSHTLASTRIKKLLSCAKNILRQAIEHGGTSDNTFVKTDGTKGGFGTHLKVYHREGEKCLTCRKGSVKRIKIGGRSAFYCPDCQYKVKN